MKKKDYENGVWRTIGGRRVFIKTGQSLSDAMKESGKFKKASDIKRGTYQRENAYNEHERTRVKFKKAVDERREIDSIIREKTYDENYADNSFFESSEYEKMKNRRGKLLDKEKKLTDEMNEYEKEYNTRLYGARYYDHPKRYKGDISKLDGKHISNRKLSEVDKEWTDLAKKMEKDYDEFGTTNWQDEKRLNELSLERDTLSIKDDKTSWDDEKYKEVYSKMSKENQNKINMLEEDMRKNPSSKNINEKQRQAQAIYDAEDKFYTRKDGTKEYDPYKGTRFEKKYDSVEDALNDPNHPTRKYIDEKLKVPRASGAKDFSEYGIRIEDNDTKARFSDYLRDKYGTDDFRIISYDDSKKAQNIYSKFNKQELNKEIDSLYNDVNDPITNYGSVGGEVKKEGIKRLAGKYFNGDVNKLNSYIDEKNYNEAFADDIDKIMSRYSAGTLRKKYSGTVDYLKQTTNMSGAEILELLKKIDEDKK